MVTRLRILGCFFVGILGEYTFFAMLLENRMLLRETKTESDIPVILGKINPKRKYAVFSTTSTTSDARSLGFIFQLPLTTSAWRRIGFNSIIIIVGSHSCWNSDPLLYMVLTNVLKLDAVVIFLNAHPMNAVMVSQVSRIFAANLLLEAASASECGWNRDIMDNLYLLTSDADMWPVSSSVFHHPDGVDILSLDAFCRVCPTFKHGARRYRMIPMAYIGARVATWQNLTVRNAYSPSNVYDLIEYMKTEFGDVAHQKVRKPNKGWFLDQRLISILISEWKKQHDPGRVRLVAWNTIATRIDRIWWKSTSATIVNKADAHVLDAAYRRSEWARLTPLLAALYGNTSENFAWTLVYYETFSSLLDISRKSVY